MGRRPRDLKVSKLKTKVEERVKDLSGNKSELQASSARIRLASETYIFEDELTDEL